MLVATRLNVFDSVPFRKNPPDGFGTPCLGEARQVTCWGTQTEHPELPDLTEPVQWVGEMRELGVALVNVSMGNPYASPHVLRPFEYPPIDGYLPPEHPLMGVDRHFRLAGILQEAFPDIPMVGSGYSFLQEFLFQAGAANLRDRRITLVGVGRAALAQPDFARVLQESGRLERKRVCRTFSYCTALMRSKHNSQGQFATGCPPFDKDVYGPIWDEARRHEAGDGAKG
jgi:2,4-dienoyl-CoA reductase-like NADH-dependent reductase (Old Yellow Enzyme family)